MESETKNIVIIGSGVAGCAAALFLHNKGFRTITIYEQNEQTEIRSERTSLNFTLCARGIDALHKLDETLKNSILTNSVGLEGRMIHHQTDAYYPYSRYPAQKLYSIKRTAFLNELLKAVEERGIKILYGWKFIGLSVQEQYCTLIAKTNFVQQPFDLLIGADGAHSSVRHELTRVSAIDCSITSSPYGYVEFLLKSNTLKKEHFHMWPRGDRLLLSMATGEANHFAATLFLPRSKYGEFVGKADVEVELNEIYGTWNDYECSFSTPNKLKLRKMHTVTCSAYTFGRTLLLGDAAHAFLPFAGQGINFCLQNALLLSNLLKGDKETLNNRMLKYTNICKPNAEQISRFAAKNFDRLKEGPTFLVSLFDMLLQALQRNFPHIFRSMHFMINFEPEISYTEAAAIYRKQQRIVIASFILIVVFVYFLIKLAITYGHYVNQK